MKLLKTARKPFFHEINFIYATSSESERLDSYECINPELLLKKFDLVFNRINFGKREDKSFQCDSDSRHVD